MARTRTTAAGTPTASRAKTAVIWLRGFKEDDGTRAAQVDAMARNARMVELKNENWYDDIPDPVQGYDLCYTDDEQIAADYKAAGIEVIDLSTFDAPPKDTPPEARGTTKPESARKAA